jgi:hypothetical protein
MGEDGRRYARQHWDEDLALPTFESHLLKALGELEPATLAKDPAAA